MIFNEADKGGPSGGSAAPAGDEKPGEKKADETPAPTPAPAPAPTPTPTPAPAPAPAPATQAAKPSVFARAASMLKDKSELLTQISGLEATVATHLATITARDTQIAAQAAELAELKAGRAEIEAALSASEKKNTTVETAAADKIAALGFPANQLPAVTSAEGADADAPKTIEDFQKTHSELTQKDATAASKFYNKYAQKFGL